MKTTLTRWLANPLYHSTLVRWRHYAGPVGLALLAATLLACAVGVLPWIVLAWLPRDNSLVGLAPMSSCVVTPFSALAGLALFIGQLALPVLAALAVLRERAGGTLEMLRVTLLTHQQIVDGFLVRTLLRFPVWLVALPAAPLALSAVGAGPSSMLIAAPESSRAGLLILLPLMGALAATSLIVPLLQLAASTAVGVAAGLRAETQGSAIALTLGGLFILEVLVPGACSFLATLGGMLLTMGTSFGSEPDTLRLFSGMFGASLGAQLLLGVYQAVLLVVARHWAARQLA